MFGSTFDILPVPFLIAEALIFLILDFIAIQQLKKLYNSVGHNWLISPFSRFSEANSNSFCLPSQNGGYINVSTQNNDNNVITQTNSSNNGGGQGSLTGGQTRFTFILLICIALFVRALSLFGMAWIDSYNDVNTPEEVQDNAWDFYLLDSFPSLIFFCSLSLVVLFWAKVYYASILVGHLRVARFHSICILITIIVYIFLTLIPYIFGQSSYTPTLFELFDAMLFTSGAAAFLLYGIKVAKRISERSKAASKKSSIVKRIVLLTIVCPILFIFRGIIAIKGVTPPSYPFSSSRSITSWHPLIMAGLIYFVSEWVPAALILSTFWHRKRSQRVRQRHLSNYTDSEVETRSMDTNMVTPLMPQNAYKMTSYEEIQPTSCYHQSPLPPDMPVYPKVPQLYANEGIMGSSYSSYPGLRENYE